jgi:hypothetical protein
VAAGLGLPAEDARPQHQIIRFALADIDDLEAESGACGESDRNGNRWLKPAPDTRTGDARSARRPDATK